MECPNCLSNKAQIYKVEDHELDFEKGIEITRIYRQYRCLKCKFEFPMGKLNMKLKIEKI